MGAVLYQAKACIIPPPVTALPPALAPRPGVLGVGVGGLESVGAPEQQRRASGTEDTTVLVCASLFLIPCVESVTALEF